MRERNETGERKREKVREGVMLRREKEGERLSDRLSVQNNSRNFVPLHLRFSFLWQYLKPNSLFEHRLVRELSDLLNNTGLNICLEETTYQETPARECFATKYTL